MKLGLLLFLFTAPAAFGDLINLQTSNQAVTYTGLGLNSSGAGQIRLTLGACTYNGTQTTCTLSGRYSGLQGGSGGYQISLSYSGNGPSPITGIIVGNDIQLSLSAGSIVSTFTPDAGSPTTFYYTYLYFITFDSSKKMCTGVSTCDVTPVFQTAGSSITGPVTAQFDATPYIQSVISAGDYGAFTAIAPATWIEIYGVNLGTTLRQVWGGADFNGAQAPTSLAGTTVKVNGQLGFVDYVSPNQVNVQVPSGITVGRQSVVLTTAGGSSSGYAVQVNAVQPGLLASSALKLNGVQYVIAQFSDGGTYVLPPGLVPGFPARRVKPGETVVLYGIGFGPVTPNINAGLIVGQSTSLSGLQISIGGKQATVPYAGLVSGFVGLYQFNVTVPDVPASDTTPVTFTINGTAGTQTLNLAVGN